MMKTFAEINLKARPYPADALKDLETGLCVFCAGFLGWNDAIHYARKGLTVTCVDIDGWKMREMETLYPDDWTFVVEDAWDFALDAKADGKTWEAVSLDPFLGDAAERVWYSIELFLALATRFVTVTIPAGVDPIPPKGWSRYIFPRSDRANWLVLNRA